MSSTHLSERRAAPSSSPAWSIAARLTLWYAVSGFLLVALATGSLYWVLVRNVDREDDQFLVDSIRIIQALIRDRPDDAAALRQEIEWEGGARRYARVYVRLLDARGNVIMQTPDSDIVPWRRLAQAAPRAAESGAGVNVRSATGTPFRALTASVSNTPAGAGRRVIQMALDRTAERQLLAEYRGRLWSVLALALLAAMAIGHSIARRGVRPLESLTRTAREIRSSTLDRRMPVAGLPAELSSLAETFNQMMNRLQDAFARLSSLSADLAHELRTPINNLRGQVEVTLGKTRSAAEYRDALESLLEDCVRLSRMIDSLMFLARADSPETQIARAPLEVRRELATIAELFEPAAGEAGVGLSAEVSEPLVAALDRALMQRAISNLVTNALTHTPAGGAVRIGASRDADDLRITVTDTGVGIAPEHLARVTDRFYRVDQSRSPRAGELGLGLAIVTSIVRAHGGRLDIRSTPGHGTAVEMVFPGSLTEPRPAAST